VAGDQTDESFRSSDEMMEEHQELEEDGFQVRQCRNSSGGSTTEDKEQSVLIKEGLYEGQRRDTVVSTVIRWIMHPDTVPNNSCRAEQR